MAELDSTKNREKAIAALALAKSMDRPVKKVSSYSKSSRAEIFVRESQKTKTQITSTKCQDYLNRKRPVDDPKDAYYPKVVVTEKDSDFIPSSELVESLSKCEEPSKYVRTGIKAGSKKEYQKVYLERLKAKDKPKYNKYMSLNMQVRRKLNIYRKDASSKAKGDLQTALALYYDYFPDKAVKFILKNNLGKLYNIKRD